MKPYLKRAKGDWTQGKGCKKMSARSERQYSKTEILEQLNHDEEAYLERYHKGARTRNQKARLEYRIKWYEKLLADWTDRGTTSSMLDRFRSYLREAKKELAEFMEKKGQV